MITAKLTLIMISEWQSVGLSNRKVSIAQDVGQNTKCAREAARSSLLVLIGSWPTQV